MLPILQVPNPTLRLVSKPVAIDKKILNFIKKLQATLLHQDNPKGVGLSAIQIGKPWRIFLTYLPKKSPTIHTFINPEIISASKKFTLSSSGRKKPILEGCLSIPRLYGPVYRHQWVKLKYQSINTSDGGPERSRMDSSEVKFSDFEARVIQHELDHLNGILFTDHSLKNNLPVYEDRSGQLTKINLDTPQ